MFIKTILTAINNWYLLSMYVKFIGLFIFIFVLRESGHVEGTLPSSPNFQYTCKIKMEISDNTYEFFNSKVVNTIEATYFIYINLSHCLHRIFWRNRLLSRNNSRLPNRVPLLAKGISNPYSLNRRIREYDR